ncbi:hypothetical protein H4R24_002054 [Coemansia sp. RSA 988]|nr:hypothetical protein H4R24_002054 [Coemansia sp. RSA 988]
MATKQHCAYCFSVLLSELQGGSSRDIKPGFDVDAKYPLFVTWSKQSKHHNSDDDEKLRGCIGNFSAMKLGTGLREYALISALKDSRFAPISLEEIPELSCSVSLLTDFEVAENYLDWVIGKHGIWIEFQQNGRKKTATYLPEIAQEQGWSKIEAIDNLLRKGGYQLTVTKDMRESIKLTRYQSKKAHLSYDQFSEML